jgi:hypothetical protein
MLAKAWERALFSKKLFVVLGVDVQCSFIFNADRWGFLLLHIAIQKNNQVDTVLLILSILFGPCKRMICPNIVRGHWEGLHGGCTEGGAAF